MSQNNLKILRKGWL